VLGAMAAIRSSEFIGMKTWHHRGRPWLGLDPFFLLYGILPPGIEVHASAR